jgi:hypothetical protein
MQFVALPLSPASRVIVQVAGGWERTPQMTLHVEGLDADGQPVTETASADQFVWTTTRGVYTSRAAFARIDKLWFDGLTRVYRATVRTLDTTRTDINALLPLWAVAIPQERKDALIQPLTDPAQLWRANGVTMTSARDADFDPANENGSGGVWPYWLTLIGEGLLEAGRADLAADLLKRLLKAQTAVLTGQKAFSEFYHSDEPRGLGERGNLSGIAPLHLLLRVIGVRVLSPGKVWTGGPFAWDEPVTIHQHGVTITRKADGTVIRFASGHAVDLPADAPWQAVTDPGYTPPAKPAMPATPRSDDELFD